MRGSALAALAVAAVAVGCNSELALDPVADAASRTLDSGSSRFAYVARIRPSELAPFEMRGEGALDYANDRARIVYDMAEVPGAPPGSTMEVRVTGSVVYLRPPKGLAAEFGLPAGKRWLSVDTSRVRAGRGLGSGGPLSENDPATLLRYFRSASGDVEEVGAHSVRGVATTRYRAHLDLDRLLELGLDDLDATEAEREAARVQIGEVKRALGMSAIPATVDVDADGRLRRLTMEFAFREGAASTTYDFFDFGARVEVSAPRAGVFDATS